MAQPVLRVRPQETKCCRTCGVPRHKLEPSLCLSIGVPHDGKDQRISLEEAIRRDFREAYLDGWDRNTHPPLCT